MENLPLPLVIRAEDIKKAKRFIKGQSGKKYLLKVYCVKASKLIIIKITDEYARCLGFPHRLAMLENLKQSSNAGKELFHDPKDNTIYVILKTDIN